jgi:hypothetical protein
MRSDTKGLTARRLYPHCDCTADRLTRRRRSLAVCCTKGTCLSSMGSAVGPHGVPSARRLRLSFTSTVATACCTLRVAPCMRQCPRNVLPVAVYCAVPHCCMAYCSDSAYCASCGRQCGMQSSATTPPPPSGSFSTRAPTPSSPTPPAADHCTARYGTGPRGTALARAVRHWPPAADHCTARCAGKAQAQAQAQAC